MSTTKVSVKKVQGILKKAGLSISKASSRFSSGYEVRGVYADYEYIEISWSGSPSFNPESYTQAKMEKLTSAACVLMDAGIAVLMDGKILPGAKYTNEEYRMGYEIYTLYIRKDGAPETGNRRIHWDAQVYADFLADKIAEELANDEAEKKLKQDKADKAAKEQAERMERVNLLNPTIGIDHNYLEGLFTTHVTLLDGRLAVLTVAYLPKQEYDWDAMKDEDSSRPMYNCFEVEVTYITRDRYSAERWERGTSNFTTGKGQTVEDAIRYWISREY